jgi:hypothetical protein
LPLSFTCTKHRYLEALQLHMSHTNLSENTPPLPAAEHVQPVTAANTTPETPTTWQTIAADLLRTDTRLNPRGEKITPINTPGPANALVAAHRPLRERFQSSRFAMAVTGIGISATALLFSNVGNNHNATPETPPAIAPFTGPTQPRNTPFNLLLQKPNTQPSAPAEKATQAATSEPTQTTAPKLTPETVAIPVEGSETLWAAFAGVFGPNDASAQILSRAKPLGKAVNYYNDPEKDLIWGINSITGPDGTVYTSTADIARILGASGKI